MLCLTSPVETRGHRWPVGLKLGLLCSATFIVISMDHLIFQLLALLFCLMLFALPGATFFSSGIRALKPLWPFVLVLVVWHSITAELVQGLSLVLRLITAVGLATLVTMTTRLADMMDFFGPLFRPLERFGLRSRSIELAIALVIRFTPSIAARGRQLAQSWRARSPRKPGWRLILPLSVGAIDDAEQVATALRARSGDMSTRRKD